MYFQWAACPGTAPKGRHCSAATAVTLLPGNSKNRINRKLFENKGHTPTLPKDASGYVELQKYTKREHEQNS